MEIRELRTKLKMTQEALARKLGVTSHTVKRWEKGTHRPSQLALRELARLKRKVK